MEDGLERRVHPRVKMYVPIKYRKLTDDLGVEREISITTEIGPGGLRFRAKEFIPLACRLIVEMDVPKRDRPLKAISKVAWIRKTDSGEEYEIGNKFLEMADIDKEFFDAQDFSQAPDFA